MFVLYLYSLQRDGRSWEPSLGRVPAAYGARMGCTGLGLLLGESKAQQGAMGQVGRQCGNRLKPPTPPRLRVWQEERAAQEPGIPDRLDSCRHTVFLPNLIPKKFKTEVLSLLCCFTYSHRKTQPHQRCPDTQNHSNPHTKTTCRQEKTSQGATSSTSEPTLVWSQAP